MSRHSPYQAMVDRGRKAGLSTRELYPALAARPPWGDEQAPGQPDGNGVVWAVDPRGRPVCRPAVALKAGA